MGYYTKRYAVGRTSRDHSISALWKNHLDNFPLRAPLLGTPGERADVHDHVAVGMPHEGLQCIHIFIVSREQLRKRVTEDVPGDCFRDSARCAVGRM
jgi:hypothetical protein